MPPRSAPPESFRRKTSNKSIFSLRSRTYFNRPDHKAKERRQRSIKESLSRHLTPDDSKTNYASWGGMNQDKYIKHQKPSRPSYPERITHKSDERWLKLEPVMNEPDLFLDMIDDDFDSSSWSELEIQLDDSENVQPKQTSSKPRSTKKRSRKLPKNKSTQKD